MDAPVIISGLNYDDFYGINYRFMPDFDDTIETELSIPLLYKPKRYLRASAIIGENGVLKTKMLSALVRDLKERRTNWFRTFPQYSCYVTIYSTAQDKYPEKDALHDFKPYYPCCLEQTVCPRHLFVPYL